MRTALHGDGALVAELAKADHPDKFTYDPMHPVPSYGGNVCCTGNAIPGTAARWISARWRSDQTFWSIPPSR